MLGSWWENRIYTPKYTPRSSLVPLMKITDAHIRARTQPGKFFVGDGLFLWVMAAGGRYWRLKYRHGGKEKLLALGVYPVVSLKEARERAADARKLLADGVDPGADRKATKAQAVHDAANTLRAVAGEWIDHQAKRWEPATAQRIRRALELHVFPVLGDRPLASIRPRELQAVIVATERKGVGETAARALQWVKGIYRWALVQGRIEANPMGELLPADLLKPRDKRNRLMLPEAELPHFLRKLAAYDGEPATRCAMLLMILTATRPGEARGARWNEIDTNGAMWIIPPARMKMRSEHRVPLSRQALAVLDEMRPLSGHGELVFPSALRGAKPLSDMTLLSCMARLGYKGMATPHGFRALFSSMANEAGFDADVIERQLAHKEPNAIRAAYHRSTYIKERTRLLQWWADLLDQRRSGANVVPLPQRAGVG